MAYEIGFVDSTGSEGLAHWQMLLKIKTFAEANGWTTLRYDTTQAARELILQGPGLSGDKQIFIGFRSYHDVGADYYNLSTAGFTGYVPSNTFITQPGYKESGVPSHNLRIDYWLIVNAQRITFGLKVGTPVYETGYAGFKFPYFTPSQYPYPMVVAGMLNGVPATRFSDVNHSIPYKGNRANLSMRFIDGLWKTPEAWPWNNAYLASTTQLRDTNGNYPLFPVILNDAGPNVYGELDGVFYVSGFNDVVENMIQIGGAPVVDNPSWTSAQRAAAIDAAGGTPYIVLQDVARNGFTDYYAMRLS